ncbi:MAG: hypothetical protein COX80_01990 [Candidatus Magasanikbacteria bacterium CG_4_10_14_0_2_um_filter_33_14]|uniref:Nucleotidyl transferase domain-containing protein n=1 Tax=Candidatus Magasanikbacteria bacterium CG_4_10_14_0_2_um_filter_33_14 TaxID=1974636 RepID=A0A2M7VB34_9BACT|nr:MAG: hypothetical protein COX80_01990 [Candidatus Magasanikbacteria bacterium CG_4_10_14_0_2_um_filter_33_14]
MSQVNLNNVGVVILAAGKGTRLNCTDRPKVMLEIGGKPIVSYIVNTLEKMGLSKEQIVLVVGFKKEIVEDYFGDKVSYAEQTELLGTAHAAFTGIKKLPENIENVLVLAGDDSAFYTAETLEKFMSNHILGGNKVSLLTAKVENPFQLGRIVRHENGDVEIIEKEYLTEEQEKINEISTGTFCFDRYWYEDMFPTMPKLRKLGEYGLPTALAMVRDKKEKYDIVILENPQEWFGINTLEQLEEAKKRLNQ